ncbi:hypothetical protein BDK92_7235 [Micromonospora pisi]|uniref:Uncharacterized protein n=1 Tax=Micromonospora pisi TaxID=589240 RepID=A0A495JW35_9ACTN|nr:hypothetical protein BDK92_7235 [Micromonospora pisi]
MIDTFLRWAKRNLHRTATAPAPVTFARLSSNDPKALGWQCRHTAFPKPLGIPAMIVSTPCGCVMHPTYAGDARP